MKFKKGDKVKIIKLTVDSPIVKVGDVGVVSNIITNNSELFPIRLNINGETDYGVKEEEIELLHKYPTGLEFTIQNLEGCKYIWTFAKCDDCKEIKCISCGKFGSGHQGYLELRDRVKIIKYNNIDNKLNNTYVLELLDKYNEVSDFLTEEDLNIMIGYQFDKQENSMEVSDVPHYPEDFYDFSNGVDISDEEINKWIKECVRTLNETYTNYTSISSGNTQVVVYRLDEGYEVIVSKDYKRCVRYFNEE